MVQNYISTALRHIRKNKRFSILNILGLAIGMACCISIFLYVWDELHYDSFPAKADQIYRVGIHFKTNNGMETYPNVDIAVGEGMANTFPQVKSFTRLLPEAPDYWNFHDKEFKEEKLGFADTNFFSFFSLPLVAGNAETALTEPNTIVLNKTLVKKYFGQEEAMGKFLRNGNSVFKVTGVMEDMPGNSHFHFDGVISMSTLHRTGHTWSNAEYYTYLLLDKGADPKKIEAGMPRLVAKYVVPEIAHDMSLSIADAQKSVNSFLFFLQPLREIHFFGNSSSELEHNSDIRYVRVLSLLAIFILVLACVNFTNLSTAIAARRAKELGIRKVLGSLKKQLIILFLAEAMLLAFFALLLGLVLTILFLPYFNQLAGKHFSYHSLLNYRLMLALIFLWLLSGVSAGSYPAFFLTSVNVIQVLKGKFVRSRETGVSLRSALVVFQFFVSIALIIATLITYRQVHFMQDRKPGYDKDQIVCVHDTYWLGEGNSREAFRQQLMQDPRVVNASLGMDVPVRNDLGNYLIYPKEKQASGNSSIITSGIFFIDRYYIPTLGMKIIRGRNFTPDFASDVDGAIINEAAQRELGWADIDPVGKTIVGSNNDEHTVLGVVADFNYATMKQKISPLMLLPARDPGSGMILKVNTNNMAAFLKDLEQRWKTINPGAPFSYYFLDEQFASLYASERQSAELFGLFAMLSILIACLGLFGIVAYTTEQRAKEIGIRKVLGASVVQLLVLLVKEFLLLVGIAFLFAIPVTWAAMNNWLQDFAYRTSISGWIFLLAGSAMALIALITVSMRAFSAAQANPVNVLRSE